MFYWNEKSKNFITNRKITLKRNAPLSLDECGDKVTSERLHFCELFAFEHETDGKVITVSKEQAERSPVDSIVGFIGMMQVSFLLESLEYEIKNDTQDLSILYVNDSYVKILYDNDENGEQKEVGRRGISREIVSITDNLSGTTYYSDNLSGDDESVEIYGQSYKKWQIIENADDAIMQFEFDGTMTNSINWRVVKDGKTVGLIKESDSTPPPKSANCKGTIENISYILTNGKMLDISGDKVTKMSYKKLLKAYQSGELCSVEIAASEKDGKSNVLAIRCRGKKFSLAVINEYDESIHYYYNGSCSNDYTELNGETYPDFMISDSEDVFKTAVSDFIMTGEPSSRLPWKIDC